MDFPRPDMFGNYLLEDFGDIALPEDIAWWPLQPGWWLLIGLTLLAVIYFSWRRYRHWRRNAYRRDALNALSQSTSPAQLPGILRAAAAGAFPAERSAHLWGSEWLDYLNSKTRQPCFQAEDAELLNIVLSQRQSQWPPTTAALNARVQDWLLQHQETAA